MQKASLGLLILFLLLLSAGCTTGAEEWYQRGETHHTMGRYEEAVAAYDRAVAIDPGYAGAWRNRGLTLSLLKKVNESEESFSRALCLAPGDASIYYYQALARNESGDRAGALESLDRAVSIPPRSRDEGITLHGCLMFQGSLLSLEGRSEEANVSYRRAHEVMMSTI
jgi:tetratricopeptide (TPR) repeat protein